MPLSRPGLALAACRGDSAAKIPSPCGFEAGARVFSEDLTRIL